MKTGVSEQFDVVIVGGGQAGLATSYHLTQKAVSHVVLERGEIGESWRSQRWDAFSINTTNKVNALTGSPATGEPEGFKTALGWAGYLADYAATHGLPIRTGVRVTRVEPHDDGGYLVTTNRGQIVARSIVAATGIFIVPKIPEAASHLPPHLNQLDAGTYRNPAKLAAGAVLVVGSGDSGCQIAEDLLDSGRKVYLCLSNRRRVPRRYRGLDLCDWSILSGRWDSTIDILPNRRAIWNPDAPLASGVGGGHSLSYQMLEAKGATLLGKLAGIHGHTLELDAHVNDYIKFGDDASNGFKSGMDAIIERTGRDAPPPETDPFDLPDTRAAERQVMRELDLDAAGISTVIWTIGFTHDFAWLDLSLFDDEGHPVHERGVTEAPGVYFVGLHCLHTLSSGLIYGVSRDAKHIADQIEVHLSQAV